MTNQCFANVYTFFFQPIIQECSETRHIWHNNTQL